MANRIGQVQTVLTVVAIVVLLTWGIYGSLWTFPNDQSDTIQAVLSGEYQSIGYLGPTGNGTIITPGSEAQFIMMYRAQGPPGVFGGSYNLPNGQGLAVGPFSSITPSTNIPNDAVNYAVFSYLFDTASGKAIKLWFTGPQGNLTVSFVTSVKGGLDAFFPKSSGPSVSGTNILEVSAPGNYTLHYVNTGTANETGKVEMGPSSVTYSRPFITPGLTSIAFAAVLAVFTGLSRRSRSRAQAATGDAPVPTAS
ncbi:MAG TPA: hypothetical protein VFE96_07060 [Candidatus Bathyarchaeia archaeon]|nr:hypothetical protein [Candidatus Bathyarchaeia archaeon]